MRKFLIALLAAGFLFSQAAMSRAGTFAEVLVNQALGNPAQVTYFFDNATGQLSTSPSPTPIVFKFDVPGTPFGLNPVNAILSLTAQNFGPLLGTVQPMSDVAFTITLAAAAYGQPAGSVLLTGHSVVPGLPSGDINQSVGGAANFNVSNVATPGSLIMASPYVPINPTLDQSAVWTFSTVIPSVFAPGANGILQDTTFHGNGNFSGTVVPEPGVLGLLIGSGVGGSLFFFRRRRSA